MNFKRDERWLLKKKKIKFKAVKLCGKIFWTKQVPLDEVNVILFVEKEKKVLV